jgi:hypothetical protein
MAKNLDRFKQDLDRLIARGALLRVSMERRIWKEKFPKQIEKAIPDPKAREEFVKTLPEFNDGYEGWYSEALVVIRQLLPDRAANFVSLYEKSKTRKEIEFGTYVIQDFLLGLEVKDRWGETKVGISAAIPQFEQQVAILKACQSRFESSLFEIRQLVQADLFDREIDVARELLKKKFYRAAGAIAGVVLERHLHQVVTDHQLNVTKKHSTISVLNDLLKEHAVIDVPQWRHISLLGDIRNLCDHSKQSEPKPDQVQDLITGVEKVLKTIS